MSCSSSISAGTLYALSRLVSNASFQRVIFDEEVQTYGTELKNMLNKVGLPVKRKYTVGDLINYAYQHLLTHYRHEYLYKSALMNSFILKNYSLSDSILLNEFKIGKSKADTVLVNGTNKVFEIKTELDSPERLTSQLSDYYKAFSEVFILVHSTKIGKYRKLVADDVGIMSFGDNSIEVIRPATPNNSLLDIEAMMRALRKDEYLQVVKLLSGNVPVAKPTQLFRYSLDLVSKYAPDEVQAAFLRVIKERINNCTNGLVGSDELPDALRLPCYFSNVTQKQYLSLIRRLKVKI